MPQVCHPPPIRAGARVNVLRLLCAGVLLACVVALWAYLRYVGALPGDEALLRHARGSPELRASHGLQFLGNLGTKSVALATVLTAAIIISGALGALGAAAVLLSAVGVMLNHVIRTILGPTPTSEASFGALVESYPSGHVVYATSVFGILAWLAWRHGRREVAAILAGLILVMGPALVLSAAHLLSDVLGGYLLGGAWLLIVLAAYATMRADRDRRLPRLG